MKNPSLNTPSPGRTGGRGCRIPAGAIAISLAAILTCWAAPTPVDLSELILEEGKPSEIRFSGAQPNTTVPFAIHDYSGAKIGEGTAQANAGGDFAVKIQQGAGFYELVFPDQDAPVGLMVLRPAHGNHDPFFCIDTAMSWHGRKASKEGLMAMLSRLGLGLARERYSWVSTNPGPGELKLEHYEIQRDLYRKHGVSVLECFHDAPKWIIGEAAIEQGNPYPQDMVETVNFWKSASERLGPSWGAMEVWNEPELMGGKLPPDQYLPTVKAVRYALHEALPSTPIVGGVFFSLNPSFLDQAALNGLLEESDVVSYHYYEESDGVLDDVEKRRYWLKKFGHESKPLWITEAGGVMESPGGKTPSREQQARSALTIAGNAAEFKACGIERYFAFLYVYFLQGKKDDFGMLARNDTPRRSLAAYTQMARLLGNAPYIGDLPIGDPRCREARVFQVDPQSALVVVTTGEVDPSALIRLPVAAQEVRGIDGRLLEKKSDTVIPVPDGLSYVKVGLKELQDTLDRNTRAMKLWEVARRPSNKLPPPSPIILQPVLDSGELKSTSRGYYLTKEGQTFQLNLKVSNVSAKDVETTVQINGDAPVKVTVPAEPSVEIPATIDVTKLPVNEAWISELKITATAPGVEQITPAVVWINMPRGIETYLEDCTYQYELPISDASRWTSTAASSGRLETTSSSEAPYGFTVNFGPGTTDRWAFPRFSIPVEADLDKVTGVLVRARCEKPATVRLMTWNDDGRLKFTDFPIIKADGEWQVAYVALDSFLPSKDGKPRLGKQISIGMNTGEESNKLEISDLFLIGRKQDTPKVPSP